jgi:redox-sensitive bicupin YhaK (pirin superfamily)
MVIRQSKERGHANHGWLDSYHTFSFADYYDPAHMGFRSLRVINEDFIAGGTGFSTHGHRDMEIVSYMVACALEHKDTMGNSSVIKPGEVQYMSAGSGVRHSEFNHYKDRTSHLIQIWIMPSENDAEPRYGQKNFNDKLDSGELTLVVSPDGQEGSIAVRQDAYLYAARTTQQKEFKLKTLGGDRGFWVQVVKGQIEVNGNRLLAGDAVSAESIDELNIKSNAGAEFLVFDLA